MLHVLRRLRPLALRRRSCALCDVTTGSERRGYSSRGLAQLQERGLLAEIFPDDRKRLQDFLNADTQCFYAGFDPTADSLHIGNLLVLVALLHCQRAGHSVIALIGGATAQIGDPSGRRTERTALDADDLETNVQGIRENVERVFANHERHFWEEKGQTDLLPPISILDNTEWYSQYSLIDFLSIIGRRFRMSNMLSRSSVKDRLSSPDGMSFTEFSYQMLQAYDWLYLWRKHGCALQVGGTDQRGNMVSGYELVKGTTDEDVQLFGVTVPLITTSEGDKLGKSAGNTIWLDSHRSSPYDLYQYLVRTRDTDVGRLLRLLTFYNTADIDGILSKHSDRPEARHAQKKLAENVVTLVHGADGLASAKRVTSAIYDRDPEVLVGLAEAELRAMFRHSPVAEISMQEDMTMLDLAMAAQCFGREADARRIMSAGGFHVNQRQMASPAELFSPDLHVLPSGLTLLRVGKKNYYIVKWV